MRRRDPARGGASQPARPRAPRRSGNPRRRTDPARASIRRLRGEPRRAHRFRGRGRRASHQRYGSRPPAHIGPAAADRARTDAAQGNPGRSAHLRRRLAPHGIDVRRRGPPRPLRLHPKAHDRSRRFGGAPIAWPWRRGASRYRSGRVPYDPPNSTHVASIDGQGGRPGHRGVFGRRRPRHLSAARSTREPGVRQGRKSLHRRQHLPAQHRWRP